MVQPMTSGPCAFWNEREDRLGGKSGDAPKRPHVPRPMYRRPNRAQSSHGAASVLALPQPAYSPVAAHPTSVVRRSRTRSRRRVSVQLYLRRAQMILVAAVIVGAAFVAGQRLWRAVLGPAPSAALIAPLTVRPGDSLWSLARRYGDPSVNIRDRVDALARANGLSSQAALTPGQRLIVSVGNPAEAAALRQTVAASETMTRQ